MQRQSGLYHPRHVEQHSRERAAGYSEAFATWSQATEMPGGFQGHLSVVDGSPVGGSTCAWCECSFQYGAWRYVYRSPAPFVSLSLHDRSCVASGPESGQWHGRVNPTFAHVDTRTLLRRKIDHMNPPKHTPATNRRLQARSTAGGVLGRL